LYRLLDKARKTPLLWITGPPGCGKTALVSSYIESRRLPCLWYKVDEADADLATFFYYLGLAAGKAAPRKRKRLPLLTPERMPGLSVFAQRYFEDLSSMLPVPSLLVGTKGEAVRTANPVQTTSPSCHRTNTGPRIRQTAPRVSDGSRYRKLAGRITL
jgi:hypothetical protein